MAVAALLEDFHDSERHGDNDQGFEKLLVIGQQLCQLLYCGSAFQNDGIAGFYHVIGGLGDPLFLGQIMGGTGGKRGFVTFAFLWRNTAVDTDNQILFFQKFNVLSDSFRRYGKNSASSLIVVTGASQISCSIFSRRCFILLLDFITTAPYKLINHVQYSIEFLCFPDE